MALYNENTPEYSVTTPEQLRMLCIKHGWFTGGTNEQYERMFRLNDEGKPIIVIAGVIWLCSDKEDLPVIRTILEEEHRHFLEQDKETGDRLFALRLSVREEKQFVVKAPDLETAERKLMDAYNFGKVEVFTDLTEPSVKVTHEKCDQDYIDRAGAGEFEIIE